MMTINRWHTSDSPDGWEEEYEQDIKTAAKIKPILNSKFSPDLINV